LLQVCHGGAGVTRGLEAAAAPAAVCCVCYRQHPHQCLLRRHALYPAKGLSRLGLWAQEARVQLQLKLLLLLLQVLLQELVLHAAFSVHWGAEAGGRGELGRDD